MTVTVVLYTGPDLKYCPACVTFVARENIVGCSQYSLASCCGLGRSTAYVYMYMYDSCLIYCWCKHDSYDQMIMMIYITGDLAKKSLLLIFCAKKSLFLTINS